jgi:hypothetical protein
MLDDCRCGYPRAVEGRLGRAIFMKFLYLIG